MNTADRLLHHRFSDRACRTPAAAALILGKQRLTYGDVDRLSNQLASFLLENGASRGDRVAILAPKCPEAIVGMLAALKADGVYVPMDSGSPAPRLAKIIAASRPRWIFTVSASAELLDGILAEVALPRAPTVIGLTDEPIDCRHATRVCTRNDWQTAPAREPATRARSSDAAHLLFTSGSTGVPKGVVITHANVNAFIDWATDHFGIGPDDRNSSHAPLHFDLSTFDVFGTLGAGAELHLVPADVNLMPQKLAAMIRDSALTQWFSVPSILNFMASFDALRHGDFPDLRRVMWCGEVLPTPTLIYWMERLPHVRFTNLYGPTEATIASTWFDVATVPTDPTMPIPIGRPCDGESVVVLDQAMKPVPVGEIGDLYISGVGLSPGYWENPEQTAKVFVQGANGERIYRTGDLARFDQGGVLHFVGRADTQIKSRGYRIELGEIEAALHTLADLEQAAVVAIPSDGFEGWTICCAYSLKTGRTLSTAALRKQLAALLPNYMLPARWLPLRELPQNANGKIDRRALKETFGSAITTTAANP